MLDTIIKEGYSEVLSEELLVGRTYMLDHQCPDIIVFSHDERDEIESHRLVTDCQLVIQVFIVRIEDACMVKNEKKNILLFCIYPMPFGGCIFLKLWQQFEKG